MASKPQFRSGQKFGAYTLIEICGSGGNAEVWRAKSPSSDVAIKLLRSRRAEPYARFRREVDQLRRLGDIPGVLPYLDSNLPEQPSKDSPAWLTMPIAQPLRDALQPDPTVEAVIGAILSIARTLASLHAQGVSHRDIKPENLYWRDGQWLIGDFGLVDAPDVVPLTEGAVNLGPRYYLAPEMILDPNSADGLPADVYSLGKTMWVLVTGQRFPLPGEHRLDVDALMLSPYRTHPRMPSLEILLEAMTRFDPNRRPSADSVGRELADWLAPQRTPATGANLSDIANRIRGVVQLAASHDDRLATRRRAADRAMAEFVRRAESVTERCYSEAIPVANTRGGRQGGFDPDPSNKHIAENLSIVATTQMQPLRHSSTSQTGTVVLGDDPPESRSERLLIQAHREAPGLVVWIGVSSIPRHDPEIALLAGASIVDTHGYHTKLWSTQRWAVLGGPGEATGMDELIEEVLSRLPSDLEVWADRLGRWSERSRN